MGFVVSLIPAAVAAINAFLPWGVTLGNSLPFVFLNAAILGPGLGLTIKKQVDMDKHSQDRLVRRNPKSLRVLDPRASPFKLNLFGQENAGLPTHLNIVRHEGKVLVSMPESLLDRALPRNESEPPATTLKTLAPLVTPSVDGEVPMSTVSVEFPAKTLTVPIPENHPVPTGIVPITWYEEIF
ncbi:MAG: hypothetical protein MMC23_006827 [Stictis urceolatum]|nr:hypothetical protein [Stictis urceolata]